MPYPHRLTVRNAASRRKTDNESWARPTLSGSTTGNVASATGLHTYRSWRAHRDRRMCPSRARRTWRPAPVAPPPKHNRPRAPQKADVPRRPSAARRPTQPAGHAFCRVCRRRHLPATYLRNCIPSSNKCHRTQGQKRTPRTNPPIPDRCRQPPRHARKPRAP